MIAIGTVPDLPDILRNEFAAAAETRGDDPNDVLERLMLEYIRSDRNIADLLAKAGKPVRRIDEYDSGDNRPLGREAIEALPTCSEPIEIDPMDITDDEIPQDRDLRRELILGALRYQHRRLDHEARRHDAIIRQGDVVSAAESVEGDLNTEYKKKEYVEMVIDEHLIRHPYYEQVSFFGPSDIEEYLRSLNSHNHRDENDVWELSEILFENYPEEIDRDMVNDVRERFSFRRL